MATKTKAKRKIVILGPDNPPDSFTREELRRALKAVAERRRQKPKSTPNAAK